MKDQIKERIRILTLRIAERAADNARDREERDFLQGCIDSKFPVIDGLIDGWGTNYDDLICHGRGDNKPLDIIPELQEKPFERGEILIYDPEDLGPYEVTYFGKARNEYLSVVDFAGEIKSVPNEFLKRPN